MMTWWKVRNGARQARRLLGGQLEGLAERAHESADQAHCRAGELEAEMARVNQRLDALTYDIAHLHEENELHGFLVAALTEEIIHLRGESQRQAVFDRVVAFVDARTARERQRRESMRRAAILERARERAAEPPAVDQEAAAEEG